MSIVTTAYLAPSEFESELSDELAFLDAKILARYGRLIHVAGPPLVSVAWAQDVWPDPELIEVDSISDAARKLKVFHSRWVLESFHLHRRAKLIQAQLPVVKFDSVKFLDNRKPKSFGAWTLIDEKKILASPRPRNPFPLGEGKFAEDKLAPSRAYLKLWELFTAFEEKRPQAGERCLELGASPGGWTWVLAKLGCKVIAVDRSPLAKSLSNQGQIEFRKQNAFTLRPKEIGPIDWLFSDVICYPAQLLKLVSVWLESGLCRNFVCTIKLKGKTDHEIIRRFREIQGSRLQHLSQNKHELTWWLVP